MAKLTAAQKAKITKTKGNLAKASKALAGKANVNATVVRKSITPGTVLIVLAGAHKGKRVVYMKPLASGKLLVTGPFKVNGVPLTRIDQTLVIATSSKVALPEAAVKAAEGVCDKCFKDIAAAKRSKEFFVAGKKSQVFPKRAEAQKAVDAALLPAIKALGQDFVSYLGSYFTLNKHQQPHNLKF